MSDKNMTVGELVDVPFEECGNIIDELSGKIQSVLDAKDNIKDRFNELCAYITEQPDKRLRVMMYLVLELSTDYDKLGDVHERAMAMLCGLAVSDDKTVLAQLGIPPAIGAYKAIDVVAALASDEPLDHVAENMKKTVAIMKIASGASKTVH